MKTKGLKLFLLLPMIFWLVFSSLAHTAELIVDNGGAGTSSTGTWFTVSSRNAYGGNWAGNNTGNGTGTAIYTFEAEVSGYCEVFTQWSAGDNRCTDVPIVISDNGVPLRSNSVNQQVNHFQWIKLGTGPYNFSSGIGKVTFASPGGCQTNTDGVKFVCSDAPPPLAGETVNKRPSWEITQDGTDKSIDWVDHAPNPRFAIYHAEHEWNDLVLDKATGLVWTRQVPSATGSDFCNPYDGGSWEKALNCAGSVIGGYSTNGVAGWRLPGAEELGTLWTMNPTGVALPLGHPFDVDYRVQCDWDQDPSCRPWLFWTSTTYEPDPSMARAVSFQCEQCWGGEEPYYSYGSYDKSQGGHWWYVRGGK
ncbi:MAG: DUF1566 domain-containing protein [Thermodesulfobacteriota bacterium]